MRHRRPPGNLGSVAQGSGSSVGGYRADDHPGRKLDTVLGSSLVIAHAQLTTRSCIVYVCFR